MAVVGSLLVSASAPAQTAPPVRIFNTNGSTVESNWTVVVGTPPHLNPRRLVLDNGLVRITHPPTENTERAGHILWVKIDGQWRLAGDPDFGDWTYTGSSFTDSDSSFAVRQNTSEVARIELSFDFHRHEWMGNVPFPVKKTIVLRRGAYGYRAMLNVPSTLAGEREVGFGGTNPHLFSYTGKMGILWNPFQLPPEFPSPVDYVWLRDAGNTSNDWWGASLAFDRSYYRLVSVRPGNPAGFRTGQFAYGNTGHLIHWAFEGFSSYEAYIAAVPYDGSMARNVTVQNGWATVRVPQSGTYTLYTRTESGRRLTYRPIKAGIFLNAGSNTVDVRGLWMAAPIVVPVSNGSMFPEDISRRYREGQFD